MLKRDITYENFNGVKETETFYFNLTRTEIVELELSYDGGLEVSIQRIIDAQNVKALITEFKRIVLLAYGVRSEDGKRFMKSDELREAFSQTAAYDALFMELATDDNAAAIFIKGIIPSDMSKEIDKIEGQQTFNLPPVPPKAS
jgi:hypothetical protein